VSKDATISMFLGFIGVTGGCGVAYWYAVRRARAMVSELLTAATLVDRSPKTIFPSGRIANQNGNTTGLASAVAAPLDIDDIASGEWSEVGKSDLEKIVDVNVVEHATIRQHSAHAPVAHPTLVESLDLLANLSD